MLLPNGQFMTLQEIRTCGLNLSSVRFDIFESTCTVGRRSAPLAERIDDLKSRINKLITAIHNVEILFPEPQKAAPEKWKFNVKRSAGYIKTVEAVSE